VVECPPSTVLNSSSNITYTQKKKRKKIWGYLLIGVSAVLCVSIPVYHGSSGMLFCLTKALALFLKANVAIPAAETSTRTL
jgi:hypothetical protein